MDSGSSMPDSLIWKFLYKTPESDAEHPKKGAIGSPLIWNFGFDN